MNSILYPACALISLLALVFKLRVIRTDRSPTQLGLVGNFFFLFVTFTLSTPAVWVATSRAVGIVNFSGLLSQSTVILSAACQQLVLLHLSHSRDVAWRRAIPRLAALAVVLLGMVTLFCTASSLGERPDDFALTRAKYYPAYLAIYLLGYAANQIDIGIMGWRYAKIAPTPWLRRGLRLVAVSMPFAMIYTGCRIADIVAAQFDATGHPWEPIAQLAIAGTVVKTVGWTLPDWGRYLSSAWNWFDLRRTHRELAPLHRAVTAQVPEPVLVLERGADLRTRLYRRVVEIRDAQWALRTWMDPVVADAARGRAAAAGLSGDDLAAVVEAAQLKEALRAKARQREPVEHMNTPRIAQPQDLAAELAFQRKLARAFARSPLAEVPRPPAAGPRPVSRESA
ncbi:MAB_1171c family putative transporter [Streptomyces sp. NPDC001135]